MLIDQPLGRFTRLFHRAQPFASRDCPASEKPLLSVVVFLVFWVVLSVGVGLPRVTNAQTQAQHQSKEQVPLATQARGQADLERCPWSQAPSSRADALRFLSLSAAQRDQELADLKTHEPQ